MLRAFVDYRAGFLPEPGGMLDQTATFAEAMNFLTGVVRHHEDVEMDRRRSGN